MEGGPHLTSLIHWDVVLQKAIVPSYQLIHDSDADSIPPIYCAIMLLLVDIAEEITKRRKTAGLSQTELAKRSLVSRSTLESLENGRIGELGYAKVNRILLALGLEFKMQEMSLSRPTLDELMIENEREDALLRRSLSR
jgi:predicted XRE-type DNA-binding protein